MSVVCRVIVFSRPMPNQVFRDLKSNVVSQTTELLLLHERIDILRMYMTSRQRGDLKHLTIENYEVNYVIWELQSYKSVGHY